jgi:hypothetical protein
MADSLLVSETRVLGEVGRPILSTGTNDHTAFPGPFQAALGRAGRVCRSAAPRPLRTYRLNRE